MDVIPGGNTIRHLVLRSIVESQSRTKNIIISQQFMNFDYQNTFSRTPIHEADLEILMGMYTGQNVFGIITPFTVWTPLMNKALEPVARAMGLVLALQDVNLRVPFANVTPKGIYDLARIHQTDLSNASLCTCDFCIDCQIQKEFKNGIA